MHPGHSMPKSLQESHEIVDARGPGTDTILFEGAVEGHVLVKNTKETLPLSKLSPRILSAFGYSATSPDAIISMNGGLEGAQWLFDRQSFETEEGWSDFHSKPSNFAPIARNGTLIHGGGSGATTPFSFISPYEALRQRASDDGTVLLHDFVSSRPVVNSESDACIVFGNAWASEGYDRPAL